MPFLGWLSDPFKWLSDLQLGDEKVTLKQLRPLQVAIGTDLATALRALRELDEVHRTCESPPKKRRKVEAEEMKGGAGRFDGSEIPNNHLKRIQPRKVMGYFPY